MTVRKAILLACLLLIPISASAGDKEATYTIKKGDTLWGISERFLKDPDYWPDLWANNPFITNPHFIYPGQKISLYDGRIELVPVQPAETAAPASAASGATPPETAAPEETVKPQAEIVIRTVVGRTGFVGKEELDSAGTLVDAVDNRILLSAGNTVFLEMKNLSSVRKGEDFSLFEVGREVDHPVTGEPLGNLVFAVGTVKITDVNTQTATGVLVENFREIQRGARLVPFVSPHREVTLKKAERSASGYIIAGGDDRIAVGQFDIVYINLGSDDGLQEGNMLYISRPRHASELGLQGEDVQLPEILLGNALVLETKSKTASVLILKSAGPIHAGDRVSTMTE
jgi:hypothetical protein